MPSRPEPKTDNQFLLFLEEQDSDNEVIEDEYAHYCAQPIIKTFTKHVIDGSSQPSNSYILI
jgi:hypothetical protein